MYEAYDRGRPGERVGCAPGFFHPFWNGQYNGHNTRLLVHLKNRRARTLLRDRTVQRWSKEQNILMYQGLAF